MPVASTSRSSSEIARIEEETPDTRTYFLAADGIAWRDALSPGQFVELSVFGVGEAPFCLAQSPTRADFIEVTVRRTGAVTNRLAHLRRRATSSACAGRSATGSPSSGRGGRT